MASELEANDQTVLDLFNSQDPKQPALNVTEISESTGLSETTQMVPEVSGSSRNKYYQQILDLLKNQSSKDPWLDLKQIMRAVNLPETSVRERLDRLEAAGVVRVEKRGKKKHYALSAKVSQSEQESLENTILRTLFRAVTSGGPWRPLSQINNHDQTVKILTAMQKEQLVQTEQKSGTIYYKLTERGIQKALNL